jgi:hypothetical protein
MTRATLATLSDLVLSDLVLPDGAAIRYGRHYDGPGPARYGWYRESAAGECSYLGASTAEVVERAEHPMACDRIPHHDVVQAIYDALAEVSR